MRNYRKQPEAVSSDAYFFEKDKSQHTLILGVGNYLMGDEAAGVKAVEYLQDLTLPDKTDLLDGGTGGFQLLNCFEAYRNIILIDATMDGKPAGSISFIKPKFASDFPSALSVHDVGLKDMIEAVYLMNWNTRIFLFTISVSEVSPMTVGLSQEVDNAIPEVARKAIELAESLIQ